MKGFVPQGFDVGSGEGLFGRDADGSARTWTVEEVYEWLWPDGLDADTLEGHSASYFATATAIANMATASAVIADNVLVRGDGGARGIRATGVTVDDSNNISGVVGITATGKIATTLTTEQLRLAYDATHYAPFTVGSTGILTIAPNNAGAASYVSITGRLGVGTASPAAVIEAALSTGVIGVKGTSDTTYGGYFQSTSGHGVFGTTTSEVGCYGQSTNGHGIRGVSTSNRAGSFSKSGSLSGNDSTDTFYVARISTCTTYNTTGNVLNIVDNPTVTSGTISGYLLTALISGTERVRFNPRVTDSGTAVAYFWDTMNALATAGSIIASFRTNAVEKFSIRGNGNFGNLTGAYGTDAVNNVGIASGTAPSASYPADAAGLWVADRNGVAGRASVHVWAENGAKHVLGDLVGIGTIAPSAALHVVRSSGIVFCLEKTGSLTANDISSNFYLSRTSDGGSTYNTTGNIITIVDAPTNCPTVSGYHITSSVNGYERFRFNPRVTDGASAVAYFWDTANALSTAGAEILSLRNNAVSMFTFRGNGNFGNFVGTFGTNATKALGLATGVAPTSAATDAVQLYSVDSDSETVLGIYAEKAVSTIYTSDTNTTIPIMYNGTLYHVATKTAA